MNSIYICIYFLIFLVVYCIYSQSNETIIRKTNIPVMQTHRYDYDSLPENETRATLSWNLRTHNHIYFNNEDASLYLKQNFGDEVQDAFEKINVGAFKADMFRLCWIYNEGGIYADCDSVCLIDDIDSWVGKYPEIDLILTRDDPTNPENFYQGFIYSRKRHNPFIQKCIQKIVSNVHNYKKGTRYEMFDFTGPGLLRIVMGDIGKLPRLVDRHETKVLVMRWNGDEIMDKDIPILRHKCENCEGIDVKTYWVNQINDVPWVK